MTLALVGPVSRRDSGTTTGMALGWTMRVHQPQSDYFTSGKWTNVKVQYLKANRPAATDDCGVSHDLPVK